MESNKIEIFDFSKVNSEIPNSIKIFFLFVANSKIPNSLLLKSEFQFYYIPYQCKFLLIPIFWYIHNSNAIQKIKASNLCIFFIILVNVDHPYLTFINVPNRK